MYQNTLDWRNHEDGIKNSSRKKNRMLLTSTVFLPIVLLIIFIISVWIVFRWMGGARKLPLEQIVVKGELSYTRKDDIHQLMLSLLSLDGLIRKDVNIIKKKLEILPWIKQVSVSKQRPNTLEIHLIEYVPIALWNNQHMVDIDGNCFSVPKDRKNQKDLPKLYGLKDSHEKVLQGFLKIKKELEKHHLKLQDATMTARHSWKLTLTNGMKLNLGRDNIMERLSVFSELYPFLQQQVKDTGKQIDYVDLRYKSGAAVSWKLPSIKESNQKRIQEQIQAE